jgi:hypothetical protein
MTTNNRIKVSELDYLQIRENLKEFLKGQSQFTDYNFEGSALSIMLDVLAYNTHYNALYTNLAVNEMFLDSASKRSSVVSIANNFAYTPVSAKCSRAVLSVNVVQPAATAQIKVIPKFSSFSATVSNVTYNFYTNTSYSAQLNNGEYDFESVEVFEGIPQTFLFVCTQELEKFVLPNTGIDTATIEVTIRTTSSDVIPKKYELADGVLELTETSEVYYIKELESGEYELSFGRNGLGMPIAPGNIISVSYIVPSRAVADGASLFIYTGPSLSGTTTVSTLSTSAGGAEPESIDNIKYNVTRSFYSQNRAVTAEDYASLIKRLYPDLKSVTIWGGEYNNPPVYGKVFLSIRPNSKAFLSPTDKSYIKETLLKTRNIVSITPEIIDPTYIELEIESTVYYSKSKTTKSEDQIVTSVTNVIKNYRDVNLNEFNSAFRMSKLTSAIDASDSAIVSNITKFTAYVDVTPKYLTFGEYNINFENPVYQSPAGGSINTTGFFIDSTDTIYYISDDGIGRLFLYSLIPLTQQKVIKNANIGSVNYQTGQIKVNGLYLTNLAQTNLYFMIKTSSYDVIPVRNQLIDIPNARITVSVVEDTLSRGLTPSNSKYTFTTSRS